MHIHYVWFDSIGYAKLWADTCSGSVKLGKQNGKWYVGF